jgi:hypothetical protein
MVEDRSLGRVVQMRWIRLRCWSFATKSERFSPTQNMRCTAYSAVRAYIPLSPDGFRLETRMTVTDTAWVDLLRRAAVGEHAEVNGRALPTMQDITLQMNTVGQAGSAAIEEAWAFAAQCLVRFRTSPQFTAHGKVLLDFGTGWARIARCFLRDFLAENMVGADVSPDLIATCRATFPGPRFIICTPMPPLALEAESVDFIVGYSVFSHLSDAACRAWTAEFVRVLKPGGMAALTTRGRWFFDYAASLTGADPYSRALAKMFTDFADARASYDRGEFVHSNVPGVTGGGVLHGGFYGETFIPEQFAREQLGIIMPLVEFSQDNNHPILFFQKPVR